MEMEMEMEMEMMAAPYIPNHIIEQILFRLSPKSLLRLRWTCKCWFDLITRDSVFIIRMHLHHRATTTTTTHNNEILRIISSSSSGIRCRTVDHSKSCICGGTEGVLHVSSQIRTTIAVSNPKILGSCNGLILIKESGHERLSIWNPFTREYRFLPFPLRYWHPLELHNLGSNNFGFCYDHTSDDYKVIRNTYYHYASHNNNDDFNNSDVQVYTLGTDSWRRIAPNPYRLQHIDGVFLNGVLYWMDYPYGNIVSFDIGKERFEHVVAKTSNLTASDKDSSCNMKLQVFEGSLCIVLKIKEEQHNYYCMEMWVLTKDYTVNNNDDETFWTKLSTISNLHALMFPIKPLRYTINGDILMVTNHNDLVLYDPKNNKYRNLDKICGHSSLELVKDVYSESLVSVNSGTYTK